MHVCTMASTEAHSRTSVVVVATSPPPARIAPATSSDRFWSRSARTTRAPCDARVTAQLSPIPRPAPVTTPERPRNRVNVSSGMQAPRCMVSRPDDNRGLSAICAGGRYPPATFRRGGILRPPSTTGSVNGMDLMETERFLSGFDTVECCFPDTWGIFVGRRMPTPSRTRTPTPVSRTCTSCPTFRRSDRRRGLSGRRSA